MSDPETQPKAVTQTSEIQITSSMQHLSPKEPASRVNQAASLNTKKGLVVEFSPTNIKQIVTELGGAFPIDEAVKQALPKGSSFVSVSAFGNSAWTITGRVVAKDTTGREQYYFLKVAFGEHGRTMLNGEYESSNLIHSLTPDFIPKPIGFGRYRNEPDTIYFYLQEFVDMDIIASPDPSEWADRLARMHRISKSPTGKFGFHSTTCDGKMAHSVDWEDQWSVFFRKLLLGVCAHDREANGPWPEFQRATQQVADKVVPRLLGNLRTSNGERIKPCLIHGDLYDGNVGISKETSQGLLFDASSYFAHNEMELGPWRSEFSTVLRDKTYIDHYLEKYPAAEPVEEFDDRNRLYSLKGTINYAAGHPGSSLRRTAYNDMCFLCEKYAPIHGVKKYDAALDPSVTAARIVPHAAQARV